MEIRAEWERVGWSQPIGPRGVEQLVYLSYQYPAGLAGYADKGEALGKALSLVMEEKRGGEKLWNSLEWARVQRALPNPWRTLILLYGLWTYSNYSYCICTVNQYP